MSHVKTRQSSCQQSWWATVVRGNDYSAVIGKKKKKKSLCFLAIPREMGREGNGTPLEEVGLKPLQWFSTKILHKFFPDSFKSLCECQNHSIHGSQGVNRQGIKRQ